MKLEAQGLNAHELRGSEAVARHGTPPSVEKQKDFVATARIGEARQCCHFLQQPGYLRACEEALTPTPVKHRGINLDPEEASTLTPACEETLAPTPNPKPELNPKPKPQTKPVQGGDLGVEVRVLGFRVGGFNGGAEGLGVGVREV